MTLKKRKTLVRYTNIAFLLEYLHTKKLNLVSPETWRDRNDVYFMNLYRELQGGGKNFALCFTQGVEAHHFWDISAEGVGGVAIEFDGDSLLEAASGAGVIGRAVKYEKIQELRGGEDLNIEDLPFTKRFPFKDENEFRLFFWTKDSEICKRPTYSFSVPFHCVTQIRLSPTLPDSVKSSIKDVIRHLAGNHSFKINKSTLLENPQFQAIGRQAS